MSTMDTMEDLLRKEITAFQVNTGADPVQCSRKILKHVKLTVLNHTKDNNNSNNNDDDNESDSEAPTADELARSIVESSLLKYVDGIMAASATATTTDGRDAIDRLMELISILSCSCEDHLQNSSSNLTSSLLDRVELFTSSSSEKVRSQACSFLGRIVQQLQDKASDSNVQQLRIQDLLLPRLKDTHQTVRSSAIRAVGTLLQNDNPSASKNQDDVSKTLPSSSFPSALEELLWSMWHDPSVANRAEAVLAVPIVSLEDDDDEKNDEDDEEDEYPRSTIDHIIARIRDIKEKVRVAAVQALHQKVDPQWMNEIQFCDTIQHGLTERCQSTKDATVTLICAKWMKAARFDPVELIRMMRPSLIEDECEKALKVVLDMARSEDRSLINELSDPELRSFISSTQRSLVQLKDSNVVFDEYQLFFTRVACATAKDSPYLTVAQKEALVAKTTPDIPTLCDLFQKHLVRLVESIDEEDEESEDQESFVCSQLLRLVQATGLNEEGSRRHFASVMATVVSSYQTPENIADMCVEAMLGSDDNHDGFLDTFLDVIKNLEDSPTDGKVRLFGIFSVILENGPSSLSSHSLLSRIEHVVLETLKGSSSAQEREIATHCLGQLGLFSSESTVLSQYKPILLAIASSKKESLQARGQAMLALGDLALLIPGMIDPLEIEDGSTQSLSQLAAVMMMHRNRHFSSLVAEVTCKLLFAGRIYDSELVARLLVLYFDPNKPSEETDVELSEPGNPFRMQQLLSLFFPAFALKSESGRTSLNGSVESALEVSLSLSSKKTKKRPLVYPMAKMVDYITEVVMDSEDVAKKATDNEGEDTNASDDVSQVQTPSTVLMTNLQVARFLARNESTLTVTQLRSLSKLIGSYESHPSDFKTSHIRAFKECLEELEEILTDATCLRAIRPAVSAVSKVNIDDDADDDEDDDVDDVEEVDDEENVSLTDGQKESDSEVQTFDNETTSRDTGSGDMSDDETVSEDDMDGTALGKTLVRPKLDKENSVRSSFGSTKKTSLSTRRALRSSTGSQKSVLESSQNF